MTPARRAALRKAQTASARKRRRSPHIVASRRRRRRIVAGAALGTAIAVGAVGAHRSTSKTLYHSTHKTSAHHIVRSQKFKSHHTEADRVYFFTKPKYDYGHHHVKVRVKKKTLRKISTVDRTENHAVYIHKKNLNGHKIRHGRAQPLKHRRKVNPYQPSGRR